MYRLHIRLNTRRNMLSGCCIMIVAVLVWGWVPPQAFRDPACRMLVNSAWIGVEWTAQPVDLVAVSQLAQQATQQQLRSLFVYTAYLKAADSFSASYQYAPEFIATFRQHNQQTLLWAWLGLPYERAHFNDSQARMHLIEFICSLLSSARFDGVHINAEPLPDGDVGFLQFLDELRRALAPTQQLSVASLPWQPDLEATLFPANAYRWSSSYYQKVASRVDQLAVMAYDSRSMTATLYRVWMREQVHGIRRSLGTQPVELLIGISVSHESTKTHRPEVESLANGLSGICASLARYGRTGAVVDGVAIYALWEAQPVDQSTWQQWLNSVPS